MSSIEERLVGCFMLAMPSLDAGAVTHATKATVAEWDSLTTVGLLSLVEEEFSISIPVEDVEEFVSFERVLRAIRGQCGLESS